MTEKEIKKEVDYLKQKLDKAIELFDIGKINFYYNKLTSLTPKSFELYKKWFNYLIFYYEDFIDLEPDICVVFENAIKKCKIAQSACEEVYISELLFLEYQQIDILTEYDPDFFRKYNAEYQIGLLNKIIEINPNFVKAYEKRAFIFQAIGENEKMKKDFEKIEILEGDKINESKLLNITIGFELSNEDQKAIINYERILKNTHTVSIKKICYESLIRLYKKNNVREKVDYYESLLDNL